MDAKHTYDELVAINAECLDALKAAETHYRILCEVLCADNPPPHSLPVLANIRAAIAKATSA